jgi:hypothetical protein
LLQRVDHCRIRAAALPVDGGTHLLLQQLEVSLPVHFGERHRQAPSGHVGATDQPQADAFTPPFQLPSNLPVELRVEVDYERLYFGYRVSGAEWMWIPQQFDASILSDEATTPGLPNFTGAFVGMACHDTSGGRCPADFDRFEYVERPYRVSVTDVNP